MPIEEAVLPMLAHPESAAVTGHKTAHLAFRGGMRSRMGDLELNILFFPFARLARNRSRHQLLQQPHSLEALCATVSSVAAMGMQMSIAGARHAMGGHCVAIACMSPP